MADSYPSLGIRADLTEIVRLNAALDKTEALYLKVGTSAEKTAQQVQRAAAREQESMAANLASAKLMMDFKERMNAQRVSEERRAGDSILKTYRNSYASRMAVETSYYQLAKGAASRHVTDLSAIFGRLRSVGAGVNQFFENVLQFAGRAARGLLVFAAASALIGASVVPLAHMADAMTSLEARTRIYAARASDVPYTFEAIYRTAQDARAPLEAIATLYTRLAPLAERMGKSQTDILRVTSTVAKSFTIGGATSAEATSSSQQLAQALGSNRFGGDELRSLSENAPVFLLKISQALGMNTGEFIKWAQAGKANTQVMMDAIVKIGPEIDRLFKAMPVTIGQGATLVGNAIQHMVGEVNTATGSSTALAGALANLAGFIEAESTIKGVTGAVIGFTAALRVTGSVIGTLASYTPSIIAVGAAFGFAAVLPSILRMVSAALAEMTIMTVYSGRAVTAWSLAASGAQIVGSRLLSGLFALLSPLNIMLAVVTAGVLAWNYFANAEKAAAEATNKLSDSQQGAISALTQAQAFSEKYSLSTTNLTASIDALLRAQGEASKAAYDSVDPNDAAGLAAVRRAEKERLLTVNLLRRTAAEAMARGATARDAAKALGAKAFLAGAVTAMGTGDLAMGQQAQREESRRLRVDQTYNAATQEFRLAQMLYLQAQEEQAARLNATAPADGAGGAAAAVTKAADATKAADDAHESALKRQKELMESILDLADQITGRSFHDPKLPDLKVQEITNGINAVRVMKDQMKQGIRDAFVESGKLDFKALREGVARSLRSAIYDALLAKPISIVVDAVVNVVTKGLEDILTKLLGARGEDGTRSGGSLNTLLSKLPDSIQNAVKKGVQIGKDAVAGYTIATTVADIVGVHGSNKNGGRDQQTMDMAAAAVGSAIGGPIGAAIAVAFTRIFGTAILGKESNFAAIATFGVNGGYDIGGSKRNADTSRAASQIGDATLDIITALGQYGINAAGIIKNIDIGTRDPTHIRLNNGEDIRSATGDANAALEAAGRALLQYAQYQDPQMRALVDQMVSANASFEDIVARLDKFVAAQKLPTALNTALVGFTNPRAAALANLQQQQIERRRQIKAYSDMGLYTPTQLAALNATVQALERSEIADVVERFSDAVDTTVHSLKDFRNVQKEIASYVQNLSISSLSPLSTGQQAELAGQNFFQTLNRARGGDYDALSSVTDVATAYLERAQQQFGSTEAYATIFQTVQDALALLSTQEFQDPLRTAIEDAAAALEAAITAGSQAVVDAINGTGTTTASNDDIVDQLAENNDLLRNLGEAIVSVNGAGLANVANSMEKTTTMNRALNGGMVA